MPRILFDSITVAQDVADIFKLDWDGCNSVAGLYTEEAGFEETVERLKSEWCMEGQCCELSSAHSNPSLGGSIIMLDESYLLWDKLLEAETESLNLRWKRRILRRDILKIEGVPNAGYQANDSSRVFVFQSLLERVKECLSSEPNTSIAELVAQSLPDAWMSAQKAVVDFEIVPRPYSLIEIDGKLTILHEPFNAVLPPRFDTESKRYQALAKLLLGERLPGVGEFVFRGQAMTRLNPPNLNLLSIKPELGSLPEPEPRSFPRTRLQDIKYHPELPLLSEQQFEQIKAVEITWKKGKAAISEIVNAQLGELWQILPEFVSLLPQDDDEIPDYILVDEDEEERLRQWRSLYPELQELSDSSFYWLLDSYQEGKEPKNWYWWSVPSRDEQWVFDLLGSLVESTEIENTEEIGIFIGYALLSGKELSEAIAFAQKYEQYYSALVCFDWHLNRCLRYLAAVPDNAVTLPGERVYLLADLED